MALVLRRGTSHWQPVPGPSSASTGPRIREWSGATAARRRHDGRPRLTDDLAAAAGQGGGPGGTGSPWDTGSRSPGPAQHGIGSRVGRRQFPRPFFGDAAIRGGDSEGAAHPLAARHLPVPSCCPSTYDAPFPPSVPTSFLAVPSPPPLAEAACAKPSARCAATQPAPRRQKRPSRDDSSLDENGNYLP